MKTKKITIRLNEKNFTTIKEVAEFLEMDLSNVLRHSLRFGLNSLLKFETSGKMTLKKLEEKNNPEKEKDPEHRQVDQERPIFEDHGDYIIFQGERMTKEEFQEKCEIARTPFLTENE